MWPGWDSEEEGWRFSVPEVRAGVRGLAVSPGGGMRTWAWTQTHARAGERDRKASLTATQANATWCERVRSRIPGFEKIRLHDLRHSAASDALMAGVPLAVVGKILGHRKPETTARYAHIADAVVTDAVEAMSQAIEHGNRTGKRLRKP